MNNLCCLINPRVVCDACGISWCFSCSKYSSDHLLRTGFYDIRICDSTGNELTYRTPAPNGVTIWRPAKRFRR